MDIKTTITLNNGLEIPQLGLGVFKSKDGPETYNAVRWALEAGYRHIDTAKIYGNEASVGQAIKDSGIPRSEIFITTKLWNDDMRQDRQEAAFQESLAFLQTDYIDLYLIHWPVSDKYVESWHMMEKLYAKGLIKAIGLSNFNPHHMETLMETAQVLPAVNQIELHPQLGQPDVVKYFTDHKVAIECWSPLGRGNYFDHPVLVELAQAKDKTVAQIILRWHLQHGYIVIPKSIHQDRIMSNCQLYDFQLSAEDMTAIDGLNINKRQGSDPENFKL